MWSMKPYVKYGDIDLQSLFWLIVKWCAQLYSLADTPQASPPPPALSPPLVKLVYEDAIGQLR